jgi:CDP-2,3-bis-(O-geranylgeranyl)-sn-glycerol synthase
MDILNLIIVALWFILPAYFANAAPILFGKIFRGKFPIDFGKTWNKKPILGKGKTWPGFLGGILVGTFVGVLQGRFLAGLLLSIGALVGDLVKSFAKRRFGIAPGKSWPIIDQLDFVIGALLLVSIIESLEPPPLEIIIIVLVLTPLVHLAANTGAYLLKLKKVWY